MAVKYDQPTLKDAVEISLLLADFDSIRDSLYILVTMSQCSV
jgi:hypothetical protein